MNTPDTEKGSKELCCRWCCSEKHNHIQCTDSSRCHCPCHTLQTTPDTEWEKVSELEHLINVGKYNRAIDMFREALSSRDTYWKEEMWKEREKILKAWEKALRKRNGGVSGLLKVIETFDGFIKKLK